MKKFGFNFWIAITWDIIATVEMILAIIFAFNHNWVIAMLLGLVSLCSWFGAATFYYYWFKEKNSIISELS